MKVYIDDFKLLRIESNEYIYNISLEDNEVNWLKNENFNQYFTLKKSIDFQKNDKIWINDNVYPVHIGLITLTKEFEEKYRSDLKLGTTYTEDKTLFRVFSPVAKDIILVLDDKRIKMNYIEPNWEVEVLGDHENKSYHYLVKLADKYKKVLDPYSIATDLLDQKIINPKKLLKIKKSPIKLRKYVDAVIYEGHVRDLTINLDVENKGSFIGLTEHSRLLKGSVLSYIKNLGMTHLQLLPIFDFGGVIDAKPDEMYNWGYNPEFYMQIDGWYSLDPHDPYDRINSLIKVINYAHDIGLGINVDVVYNHVYNHFTNPFDNLVPGYYYRHDNNHKMTDSSFCGNDLETRNYMVRKLIVDSLVYFTKNFQIDGYRFDLMGLMDIETMKLIEKTLKAINPNIMLYGEGWNMETVMPVESRANMNNNYKFMNYAHFNDFYRDMIKGRLHTRDLGYGMGNVSLSNKVKDALIGSPNIFKSPNQSLNFIECHDNLTFYDKMLLDRGFDSGEFKISQDFANHLVAISQGIPFYHAGQEFYRTKNGVENSYNSPDEINRINWKPNIESVKKLRKLLKIRKKYRVYRFDKYTEDVSVKREKDLITYTLKSKSYTLKHIIKPYKTLEKFELNDGTLIFPSQKALTEENYLYVSEPGVYIIYYKN